MYQEFLNEASFLFLLPKRNSEALYVPSSPWQTSVRVAPPTINWGLAHNSWKDTISKFASPSPVWKVPFSCSLFQYSKTTKHFQHFFKNISFLLCLINRVPGQYFLIKLKSAYIFFEAAPTRHCQWYYWEFLLLWRQRWKFTSAFTSYFIPLRFWFKQHKWVCDCGCCLCHWNCAEFPVPTAWRMFSHPDPASWEANHTNAFISNNPPFFLALWSQPSRLWQWLSLLSQPRALQQLMAYIRKLLLSL